ncbi:hypothetical protein LINGRAHAP2_LOCUS28149 [Linum grandiflorum]
MLGGVESGEKDESGGGAEADQPHTPAADDSVAAGVGDRSDSAAEKSRVRSRHAAGVYNGQLDADDGGGGAIGDAGVGRDVGGRAEGVESRGEDDGGDSAGEAAGVAGGGDWGGEGGGRDGDVGRRRPAVQVFLVVAVHDAERDFARGGGEFERVRR